jgi:hypothetical protein
MKVNILFIFVFFVLVDSQTELKYDILGCPFGWKASGQAWYAPKYGKETWQNLNSAFVAESSYSSSLHQQQKQYSYFPREYILCLICELDLITVQGSSKNQRWIEVCGTHSTELKSKQLHFEMQECYYFNDQNGVKKYYTYGFTLNWCLNQPICAINVSLSFNFLFDSLRLASPILCSKYHRQTGSARNKNANPYKFVDLACPSGLITKTEMHNTICQGTSTSSLCILCSSEEAEFYVCHIKDCANISPNINFNSLAIPNSNLPGFDFDSKRYCGAKLDLDSIHYDFNETNLIICEENNKTNHIIREENNHINVFVICFSVSCIIIISLLIVVIFLSIKNLRLRRDQRPKQEPEQRLSGSLYFYSNDSKNQGKNTQELERQGSSYNYSTSNNSLNRIPGQERNQDRRLEHSRNSDSGPRNEPDLHYTEPYSEC